MENALAKPLPQLGEALDSELKAMLRRDTPASVDVSQMGPGAAAGALSDKLSNDEEREEWVKSARSRAIVDSIMGSRASAISGMRAWHSFHSNCLKKKGPAFPPMLNDLLAWADVFRHPRTFSNYLGYVRVACELLELPCDVFQHPSVRRAKVAVAKRRLFSPRKPMFVHLEMVRNMAVRAKSKRLSDQFMRALAVR